MMLEVKQNFNKMCSLSHNELVKKEAFTQYNGTLRKYLNPAVYVETPLLSMNPLRRNSSTKVSDNRIRTVKIKKCSCFTDPANCFHSSTVPIKMDQNSYRDISNQQPAVVKFSPSSGSVNESEKSTKEEQMKETNKLASSISDGFLLNLNNLDTTNEQSFHYINELEKKESFRQWLSRKQEEKKRKEMEVLKMREMKEKEKQRNLEKERENFAKWLKNKKDEEERKKMNEEKRKMEELQKERVKEFRLNESDLRYKLWLKKKEEAELARKIKEQIEMMKIAEEKERKRALNARAYQEWLEKSKHKPKPLPPNMGLESMKSSKSVTYVNPNPWNPNIPQNFMPNSN